MTSVKIGIGGGVFDPVHIGHLFLFNECADRLGLHEVLLVPTFEAVHKLGERTSDYEHRRNMLELASKSNSLFRLSEIEKETGGPSYTIQTIHALKRARPGCDWYFIVGLDNLRKMEDWHRPDDIVEQVTVVVGSRPVDGISSSPRFENRVVFLDIPELDISSTDIRNRVKVGRTIKYLVPEEVEDYIHRRKLYLK